MSPRLTRFNTTEIVAFSSDDALVFRRWAPNGVLDARCVKIARLHDPFSSICLFRFTVSALLLKWRFYRLMCPTVICDVPLEICHVPSDNTPVFLLSTPNGVMDARWEA